MIDFQSPEYKRSRVAYIAQCAFEYFVFLLVSDAFLAKLLSNIGMSDGAIGVISSVISLAFVIQLFSLLLMKSKINSKAGCIIVDTISQVFFALMFVVPFLNIGNEMKQLIVVLLILLAYIFKYLVSSIIFRWANSCIEVSKRGSFSAKKEMVSLLSGIIFTLIIGKILDNFEALDNLEGGFIFVAIALTVVNLCNLISLLLIKKEDTKEIEGTKKPLKDVLKNTLGNRNYRTTVYLQVLWDVARYTTIGFLGVYKTKELVFSVFAVQAINMIANLGRFYLSIPFGKFSDKTSFAKGMELALLIAAVGFGFCAFTTPATRYFIVIFTLLFYVSLAGMQQNSFNIVYSYIDIEYVTQAMAIKNCIGGVCGFLASLVAAKILGGVQANGNTLFGITIYGQQILAAISFTATVLGLLLVHFVISKQKVRKQ